jgi:hypothetical protein
MRGMVFVSLFVYGLRLQIVLALIMGDWKREEGRMRNFVEDEFVESECWEVI